jgi:hydrogenase maturation protein HypF
VAHDLHPDFFSTQFAMAYAARQGIPAISVQHHLAHIAAVCAEHAVTEAVLGLALDGIGLGTDGAPWGGELLHVEGGGFRRLGHLAPLDMPGGDHSARAPWRMAAAALFAMGRGDEIARRFPAQAGANMVTTMLQRGLNCAATSSMGRLFDAAAGLLGVLETQSYEGQAAMLLEGLAQGYGKPVKAIHGYVLDAQNVLDFRPLLDAVADCPDKGYGAALFHVTLADGLSAWAACAAQRLKIGSVALGGGCFLNAVLTQALTDRLVAQGLRVLTARQAPPNDGGISLGQAWVAMQQLNSKRSS